MIGEFEATKKYREIMSALPNNYYRDTVFNILSDELIHVSIYIYIVAGKEDQ